MKYDAFISYRHLELDMEIAKKVHSGLETYHIPKAVQEKTGKKKIQRVFRDQEELPIGSDLNDNISTALEESEYLIVICSSETPDSYWVCKEIETFIGLHGREHILAVLIEGEPDRSFPPMLLTDDDGNPVEPLAADIRGVDRKERNKKFKTEILRLAAPVIGCTYDDLRQRHRERMIKRTVTIASAAAAIVALAGVAFGIYNANVADKMQKLADEKAKLADEKTALADEKTALAEEISLQYRGKQENQSRFYAQESLDLLRSGNREDAVLVAMEGLPFENNERPYVPDAEYALGRALYAYDSGSTLTQDRILHHDLSIDEIMCTYDKSKIVSIDSGNKVYVWDVSDWTLKVSIEPAVNDQNYYVEVISADADDTGVYVATRDTLFKYDYTGGLEFFKIFDDTVEQCKLFEKEGKILIVCRNGLSIMDSATGQITDSIGNTTDQNYLGKVKKYPDKDIFVIPHYGTDVVNAYISVFDPKEMTVKDVKLSEGYILDMYVTQNGNIAAVSCNNNLMDEGVKHVMVDLATYDGQTLWSESIDAHVKYMLTFNTIVKAHSYEEEGTVHDEIVIALESEVFTLDENTGALIASFGVPGDINALALSTANSFGRVGYSQGGIDFMDFAEGRVYSEYTVDTSDSIREWVVINDMLAFSSVLSPDVCIMKWHKAPDMEDFVSYDDGVIIAGVSDDGEYLAVMPYNDYTSVGFLDKEGRKLSDFTGGNFIKGVKLGSEKAYLIDSKGLWVVDPHTGSKDFINVSDYGVFGSTFDCFIDPLGKTGVFWALNNLIAIDIESGKAIYECETDGNIGKAVISPDGKYIYVSEGDKNLYILDTGSGERREIEDDAYRVVAGNYEKTCIDISPKGKYVALCCKDGYLRILDTETLKTHDKVPFKSYLKSNIAFTDDESHIVMQGDDYRIRIWDIDNGVFANTINAEGSLGFIICDEDSNLMAACLTNSLYLYETEGYGCVAYADKGQAYLKGNDSILINDDRKNIKRTYYKDYRKLMEEAKKQFPGATLDDEKRVKYNIN